MNIRHQRILSPEQIRDYHDTGYLNLRQVLDPQLLTRLISTTERLYDEGRSLQQKSKHYDLEPAHTAQAPRIRRISSPTELDPVYVATAFESIHGDIAADLLGGAVKFYHSKINFKLPQGGAEIGWHQDWPVFPHTNTNLVALSIPLNASRAINGCLQTIPGSHKLGPRSHWENGIYKLNCNHTMTPEDFVNVVDNELGVGDVVAHHGLAVHGSSQNRSNTLRTTYIIQYAAADSFAYTAPVVDSIHRNQMVRGELATHARVEAGVIELPPDFSAGYSGIYALQTAGKS